MSSTSGSSAASDKNAVVQLLVGSSEFKTTAGTLLHARAAGSHLEKLVGDHLQSRGAGDVLFIDRDGSMFSHVLNYLRDGNDELFPETLIANKQLLAEAKFYKLSGMIAALERKVQLLESQPSSEVKRKQYQVDLEDISLNSTCGVSGAGPTPAKCLFHGNGGAVPAGRCLCRELLTTLSPGSASAAGAAVAKPASSATSLDLPAALRTDGTLRDSSVFSFAPAASSAGETKGLPAASASSSASASSGAGAKKGPVDLSTEYSWEEIERHNTLQSCWLVVRGEVYDVTAFLPLHPAGKQAILRHGGTDATADFDFHSYSAKKKWKPFRIGRVKGHCNASSKCLVM